MAGRELTSPEQAPPADAATNGAAVLADQAGALMRVLGTVDSSPSPPNAEPQQILFDCYPYATGDSQSQYIKDPVLREQAAQSFIRQLAFRRAYLTDQLIEDIPSNVIAASRKGEQSLPIITTFLNGEGTGDKPPQLDVQEQRVFDALQAKGLSPTMVKEVYVPNHSPQWMLKANW